MAKNYLLLQFVLSTDLMTLKCYEKDLSNVMYLCIYILLQWRLKDPAYNFDKTNSLTCRQWIQTISSKQFEKIGSIGILGLGVKMKVAEELRTCRAGKTFYTFHEAAATRRHTPQSLRLAIFLFFTFSEGTLGEVGALYVVINKDHHPLAKNLSWLMKMLETKNMTLAKFSFNCHRKIFRRKINTMIF